MQNDFERERLFSLCRGMDGDERHAFRILAAAFGPVAKTTYEMMLRSQGARRISPSLPNFDAAALPRWERLGIIGRERGAEGKGWLVVLPIRELVARETVREKTFALYCEAVESTLRLSRLRAGSSGGCRVFKELWHAVYFLRKYFYLGDSESFIRLVTPGFAGGKATEEQCLSVFAATVLNNPFDDEMFSALPEVMRPFFLETLRLTKSGPELRAFVTAEEEKLCRSGDFPELAAALADQYCHTGLFAKAMELAPMLGDADRDRLQAVDALVRGDLEAARKNYARLARRPKRRAGEASPPVNLWDPFYIPLLAALREAPDKISSAAHKESNRTEWARGGVLYDALGLLAKGSSANQAALFAGHDLVKKLSKAVRSMLCAPPGQDEKALDERLTRLMDAYCLGAADLCHLLLAARWIAPGLAQKWQPFYRIAAFHLNSLGMSFVASELESAGEALSGRQDNGWHPLRDLFSPLPPWECALDALETLADGGSSRGGEKGERRLLWLVELARPEWRKEDEPIVAVRPLEQTLQAAGKWSKGREIALSAVARGLDRIPGLSEQERRVADAVYDRASYGASELWLDGTQALHILAGLPNLVRADDLSPLEVVAGEPQLEVTSVPSGCRILMTPANPRGREYVVSEESPSRLRVTHFTQMHRNIFAILGGGGAVVPEEARARTLKILSRLAANVTVQSELDGAPPSVPVEEADARLHVQLSPCGDGLNAEIVVRPSGGEGISCRPGGGAPSLFGLKRDDAGNERRVQVRRNLAVEARKMKELFAVCPALAENGDPDDGRARIDAPDACLELLLQLQKIPDVVVEWPRGGAMTVRRELDGSAMLGAIQSSGTDWFALSGTAAVDRELTLSLCQLMELLRQRRGRFVPVGEGQFVALTREFQRRLEALDAMTDAKGQELRVPPLAAAAVAELFDEGALAADKRWRELCERFAEAQRLAPETPRTLRAQLRPYQLEGFRWLARLAHWGAGACLADDMGLGKTVQTLALLLHRAEGGPALVAAPTSVCGNWTEEAARFAPTLNVIDYRSAGREKVLAALKPFDVVLTSYGLLQSDAESFARKRWHTVVLDEAQAVKNMSTKRSAAVMGLHGDFRMIMTGTPIENRLSELWNLFRFLNPGLLGSLERFNRRFASPVAAGDDGARGRLRRAIAPFLLRRVKEQVLDDLPERTEVTRRIELSPQERAFYEALRQSAVETIDAAGDSPEADKRFAIFAQLMKLRRCCCAVSLVSDGVGAAIPSSKLEALLELVDELRESGHRALVFSQFTDHLRLIEQALAERGVPCLYLDGSTPPGKRAELVRSFQSGRGDCFLISLRAGGTGLNLTGADFVVHMDPWWNPAVEDQASDRAYRIGQTRPVAVYRFVAAHTVEEKIVELHRSKRRLADSLLAGAEAPRSLDLEALASLIREEA
ncbi:MAG: DEAD/DEAH box helicase [Pyramidobacter sp.]|nr:DEAD/DEAH box helicase [Pyramidobacter sp.]